MNLENVKRIAIIGASKNPEKYGNIILRDLISKGYEVFPVNPKYEEIEGIKCYKSIEKLPRNVEILVFVVPPQVGIEIVEKALKIGFKNFWFQPGAESEEIKSLLENKEVNAVFGKCVMKETDKING